MRGFPLFLVLSGCWVSGEEVTAKIAQRVDTDSDADTDSDSDSDTDADVDILVEFSPPSGTASGGDIVTIVGGPFGDDPTVDFGGVIANVISVEGDTLVVETPASDDETWADVTVTTESGQGSASDQYYYWTDGHGLSGAIGQVAWYDYVGTGWPDGTVDYGAASIRLIKPAEVEYVDLWGPTGGSARCTRDYEPTFNLDTYTDYGEALKLTSASNRTFTMAYDSDDETFDADLIASQWANAQTWRAEASSAVYPDLDIANFLVTPDPLTVTAPDFSNNYTTVSYNFDITWNGPYTGDYVVATLIRFEGNQAVDYTSCIGPDLASGMHVLGDDAFSDWSIADQLTIIIGRATLSTAILPSGAAIEVAGVRYQVGAVYQF